MIAPVGTRRRGALDLRLFSRRRCEAGRRVIAVVGAKVGRRLDRSPHPQNPPPHPAFLGVGPGPPPPTPPPPGLGRSFGRSPTSTCVRHRRLGLNQDPPLAWRTRCSRPTAFVHRFIDRFCRSSNHLSSWRRRQTLDAPTTSAPGVRHASSERRSRTMPCVRLAGRISGTADPGTGQRRRDSYRGHARLAIGAMPRTFRLTCARRG